MPEALKIHFEQNLITGWYEVHTHGMSTINQPEIRIECSSLFIKPAANLLEDIFNHFSENNKKLKPGERIGLFIGATCEVTAMTMNDPAKPGRILIYGEDVEWRACAE